MAAQLDFNQCEMRYRAVPHKSANATVNNLSTLNTQKYGIFLVYCDRKNKEFFFLSFVDPASLYNLANKPK
jgi:hypothetical protein